MAGWFGGCGVMDCTGLENVLVQDVTGNFFGEVATAIANNEDIGYGNGEDSAMRSMCDYVKAWNGFYCLGDRLTVLEWESIGVDAKTINPAPLTVTNDEFTNKVNMWREWEWIGPEP